jgi:CheY-like chemotaxis protein
MSKNEVPLNIETLKVLVVDDMKSMRLTIRKMLQNLNIGGTLRFAENGRDGLAVLRGAEFDLAIIDWNMPVMNGIDMLEEIRSDALLRDMPIIMVTAEAERDIVSQVAETEIDGYLLKPLTLGSLDKIIKAVINKVNNPEPMIIHRKKARELEEMGDYEAAIEEIKTALTYKPSASRLIRQLGLLHFKIKKSSIAEKCLLKAVSVNNQDSISRVYLADYYLKRDELEKAGNYYLEILSLSTRYNSKAFDIGQKLLMNNLRPLALAIFSKVIARSKKRSVAREQIIEICLANDELEYPKTLLEHGIKENPSNYDMLYKAGSIILELGDTEKALKYFTKVDRHVRGHIDAKLQIAKIYCMKGKTIQADDYLNQILRIEPAHEGALALRREI